MVQPQEATPAGKDKLENWVMTMSHNGEHLDKLLTDKQSALKETFEMKAKRWREVSS